MELLWVISSAVVATLCFVVGIYEGGIPLLVLGAINGYATFILASDYLKNPRR